MKSSTRRQCGRVRFSRHDVGSVSAEKCTTSARHRQRMGCLHSTGPPTLLSLLLLLLLRAASPHADATTMFTHGIVHSTSGQTARPVFCCCPSRAGAPKALLERHEARRLGGTNTGTTVRDGLVGDGEFAQVVANHLRLQCRQKLGQNIWNSSSAAVGTSGCQMARVS